MAPGFSEYIRSLDPSGEPPTAESFDAVWKLLRQVLRHEMRKRGLWTAPPRYLGIHGGNSWQEGELLDELAEDCYTFIFIQRLPSLEKQLAVRSNVDGMVFRNVRNFLHETQKLYDPLGFRLFTMLRSAVERLLATEVLHVLEGGAKVRNETILGFQPWSDPLRSPDSDLLPLVQAWNDDLLPDLVTAWGRGWEKARERLEACIAQLPSEGIAAFRFKDLVDPLKKDVRRRWNVVWEQEEGELAREDAEDEVAALVRVVRPSTELEDRQAFEKLLACVEERLESRRERGKTRAYLRDLWLLLRDRAAEPSESSTLSNLKLSRRLDIPRDRIPGLKATLGSLVEACRQAILGNPTVIGEDRAVGIGLPRPVPSHAQLEGSFNMRYQSRRQRLRRLTGEAVARFTAARVETEAERQRPPRPGDAFVFEETGACAVEWVILEQDPANPLRLLVVPADDNPLIGSQDVAIDPQTACGLSSLRCALAVWLEAGAFDPEHRTGSVDAEALARARRRRDEIQSATIRGSIREQEVDNDPEYQEWVEEVVETQAALPGNLAGKQPSPPLVFRRSPRWGSLSSPYTVAASTLLAVTLGLVAGTAWQRKNLKELERERQNLAAEAEGLAGALEHSDQARHALEASTQEQARLIEELEQQNRVRDAEITSLERDLQEARQQEPQLDLPFVFLNHQEPVRGSEDPLVVPKGARRLALIFEVVDFEPYPAYRLRILEAETGREIWQNDRLTKRGSELSLDLPLSIFRSGDYGLEIFGLRGEAKLLESYSLSLRLE